MLQKRFQSGLSIIELLIVTTILSVLILAFMTMMPKQLQKARDSERKSDLQKIKIAFENYYSDNDCYPPEDILENCGSETLSPYLKEIPCDPLDNSKYLYAPEADSCPNSYRVWAKLENKTDPIIEELGCNDGYGCGALELFQAELGLVATEYDYGVSEGVPVLNTTGQLNGTNGYCCVLMGDACNIWTYGNGVCNNFYFELDPCNTACNYP